MECCLEERLSSGFWEMIIGFILQKRCLFATIEHNKGIIIAYVI